MFLRNCKKTIDTICIYNLKNDEICTTHPTVVTTVLLQYIL